MSEQLIDRSNRVINYLRISVTDKCNLRCIYCMPREGVKFVPHDEILSYEEILRFVRLSVGQGIRKVRLTGGEPLVRKGFISFLKRLRLVEGLEEISLTTNGLLLKEVASEILECGIRRINISLDTLRPDRFAMITGRNYFYKVREGIREAERLGFDPIKINMVVIRGVNDDEVLEFARFALEKGYHLRFIEFMPVGMGNMWSPERFISIGEIAERIRPLGDLEPVQPDPMGGPARRYAVRGGRGEIGFIGAMSSHFCAECNRMRLTAEGNLRNCLFSDQEVDIKGPLRNGKGDARVVELIRQAIESKPKDHGIIASGTLKCLRRMSSIGG